MPVKPNNREQPEPRREETRRRILEAAMRLFSEQGFARTTTRALAQAAGITEMTLFRYFAGKEQLFEAAVQEYGGKAVAGEMEAQLTGHYREDLLILGNLLMNILKQRGDAMRMMICEAPHFPAMAEVIAQNPRILRRMLASYLQRQIDAGQARPVDVDAAANLFWGMFLAYRLGADLIDEPGVGGASDEEVVTLFVDIFINGTTAGEGIDGNGS
ncbi:MAG: helix-turn-helix transcriptional regulator [Anaerolineae bacterium]|nr:helix-turn-helix transcriptional regulator [Anaerolineae bacterium]